LLEAVCRYFNIVGNWAEYDQALDRLRSGVPGGLDLSPFILLDSTLNSAGQYEHLFARADTLQGVQWVEGAFVDLLEPEETTETVLEFVELQESYGRRTAAEALRRFLELQPGIDPETPGGLEGSDPG